MFKITPKTMAKPIRSIEQEMQQTRERYMNYLKQRSDNFVAKRSNVEIRDPHTMAGDSYWELREEINTLNNAAKNADKHVKIEDARALIRDDEFASPTLENSLASQVLVSTKDSQTGLTDRALFNRFEVTASEFLQKVIDFINSPIKPKQ